VRHARRGLYARQETADEVTRGTICFTLAWLNAEGLGIEGSSLCCCPD
jgi:hypothetical protein